MMANARKILVVRGDLRSNTGYSRALRAHLGLLQPYFDIIYGVDIHFHQASSTRPFPGIVVTDKDIDQLISGQKDKVLVLNYTTPDNFRRLPGTTNVGLFYWETDRYNPHLNFHSHINLMDAIWIPAPFMEATLRKSGFNGRIFLFPWPHDFSSPIDTAASTLIPIYRLSKCGFRLPLISSTFDIVDTFNRLRTSNYLKFIEKFATRAVHKHLSSLADFRQRYKTLYLGVMKSIPRKGLNLLLSEWLAFIRQQDRNACLILKVSALNPEFSETLSYLEAVNNIQSLACAQGPEEPHIGLCIGDLSNSQLHGLYENADAFISTTLGEGFGGPVVEAAQHSLPLICPRHTALESLIPPDYPLTLPSQYKSASLRDQLHYYSPSSRWGVIDPHALEDRLSYFDGLGHSERQRLGTIAKAHVSKFCAAEAVATQLSAEMKDFLL